MLIISFDVLSFSGLLSSRSVLISMYLCILNRWEQYYYAPASATFSGIQILSVTNYIPCLFYTCYNTLLKGNIVIRALFVL